MTNSPAGIVEIRVPPVGESITEGVLNRWLVPDGQWVNVNQEIALVETDKISVEVSSSVSGFLRHKVSEGDTVQVGQVVAVVEPSSSNLDASGGLSKDQQPQEEVSGAGAVKSSSEALWQKSQDESPVTDSRGSNSIKAGPAARYHLEQQGLSVSQAAQQLGKSQGWLTKGEVLELSSSVKPSELPQKPDTVGAPESLSVSQRLPQQAQGGQGSSSEALKLWDQLGWESRGILPSFHPHSQTRKPLSPIRRRIAQRLWESKHQTAMLTTFNEIDMSRVMQIRDRFKDRIQEKHGISLGFLGFFIKAVVEAIKAWPQVNAFWDTDALIWNHYVNVGVAVSTDRGLVVPVIRDVAFKSIIQIEKEIKQMAQKARQGQLKLEDLEGATISITNGGVFGSLFSTPILNPPQTAILGLHKIQKRPVAVDSQVEIRPMMYVALSYDHRVIDGKEAVSFLVKVKECLEDPDSLIMEL